MPDSAPHPKKVAGRTAGRTPPEEEEEKGELKTKTPLSGGEKP